MMKRVALLASLLILSAATTAGAAVTFTVVTTTGSGAALENVMAGDTITMDITIRSDADVSAQTVFAIGGAVSWPDGASAVTLNGGTTSSGALFQAPTGPGTGFGGLDSSQAVALQAAGDIQFFNGVSISGTPATGANDISPITMAAGGPQAQVVVTVNSVPVTFTVGAVQSFGDAVVGQGGAFLTSNNATVVVPEAGAVASSLAALGSVFAVVGLRRRS